MDVKCMILTKTGSWNSTIGLGNKLVTFSLDPSSYYFLQPQDFYYDPVTFSGNGGKEFNLFEWFLGAPVIAYQTKLSPAYRYRPTGVQIDKNGNILAAQGHTGISGGLNQLGQLIVIMKQPE